MSINKGARGYLVAGGDKMAKTGGQVRPAKARRNRLIWYPLSLKRES